MSSEDLYLTKSEFAAHIQVSKAYVAKLHAQGRLVLADDGRVDVDKTKALLKASTGAPERAVDDAVSEEYIDYRERKEKAMATLAEMDVAERRKTLLKADDVRTVAAAAMSALRSRLEAWPDQLAAQFSLINDEGVLRAQLSTEVEMVLSELSRQFAKMAEGGNAAAVAAKRGTN